MNHSQPKNCGAARLEQEDERGEESPLDEGDERAWHRWHCLGLAGMDGMALAVGLSMECWLHHPALMQRCSGNSCPPGTLDAVPLAAASRQAAGRQRNRKLLQGYFSLCGSVCSAFCHVPGSVPNPPGSSWQATDPRTHEQDVPCLHPDFPIGATSLERAAMLGTPFFLLSSTHPSTAGSLGPLRWVWMSLSPP